MEKIQSTISAKMHASTSNKLRKNPKSRCRSPSLRDFFTEHESVAVLDWIHYPIFARVNRSGTLGDRKGLQHED